MSPQLSSLSLPRRVAVVATLAAVVGFALTATIGVAPAGARPASASAHSAGAVSSLATDDFSTPLAWYSATGPLTRLSLHPFAGTSDSDGPDADNEPATCSGCQPPLTYHGGVVMGTVGQAGAITITPIFWFPTGFTLDSAYSGTIDQYVDDIAAASGTTGDVYSVDQEYSRASTGGGAGDQIKYSIAANPPITDTTAYPSPGCALHNGFTACVTDASVQAEVARLIAADHANDTGLQYLYPVFFPAGVEITDGSGGYSDGAWCGIHSSFTSAVTNATGPIVYTEDPYPGPGCSGSEWPQYFAHGQSDLAYADGDSAVDTLSHEINEAITDPQYSASYGWFDATGNEIGDDCADIFGAPLGSTDTSSTTAQEQSEYNQVIDGDKYWTQEEFSDATYNALGMAQGCVQRAFAPKGASAATQPAPDVANGTLQAQPSTLPADGASTATVTMSVTKQDGEPLADDDVEFAVATDNGGTGDCGTLSGDTENPGGAPGGMTNADGQVSVTYTASTDNVTCDVIATEALGGTTDTVAISQGTDDALAPTISLDGVPSSVTIGATAPVSFTTTSINPGDSDVDGALTTIYLSGDGSGAGLAASQVSLSYENDTTGGEFVTVPLSGTTTGGGYISASTLPDNGVTIAAGDGETTTWHLSLNAGAPASSASDPLVLEADFDQVDASSGATSTLDYDVDNLAAIAGPSNTGGGTSTTTTTTTATVTTVYVTQTTQTVVQTQTATSAAATCTVPKVVGLTLAASETKLKRANCTSLSLIEPPLHKHHQLVVKQTSPKAGSRLAFGGTVRVTFVARRVT